MPYDEQREVSEALAAGAAALASLSEARDALKSAQGWGLLDIFGGGGISGMVKHSRINDARRSIDDAKRKVARFADELDDVHGLEGLRVDIGGFATFADFVWDNVFTDLYVQQKINEAVDAVDEAAREVQQAMDRLQAKRLPPA